MAKNKTINIHGKEYATVDQRVKYLREHYPDASLISEMVSNDNGMCVFKSTLIIEDKARATGWAYEKEGSSNVNKTSYVENCETSSWGRCLANFGILVDGSVASAEEVQNAILQQEELETKIGKYLKGISECIGESDNAGVVELWDEMDRVIQNEVWKMLDSQQRMFVKESKSMD